jgi:hypothetical protein
MRNLPFAPSNTFADELKVIEEETSGNNLINGEKDKYKGMEADIREHRNKDKAVVDMGSAVISPWKGSWKDVWQQNSEEDALANSECPRSFFQQLILCFRHFLN